MNTLLIGHIHMLMSNKVYQKLLEKKQRYPYLPEPMVMLADLQQINQWGIPAVVAADHNRIDQLLLYTSSYYIALYESSRQNGYIISHVDAFNLREHERLSKGSLKLQAASWNLHGHVQQLPLTNRSYWDAITQGWRQVEAQRRQTGSQPAEEELTHAHERYLDTVEDLIEVTHRLEQEKNSLNAGIPYRGVESTAEERDAPRDIYVFRLAEIPQLTEKNMLCIKGQPDLRGRVISLEGIKLTLKFESLIDKRRIHDQGSLEPTVSPLIYQKQREAVQVLRAREAKNAHLLRVLVDRYYLPYQRANIEQNGDDGLKLLSHEQFDAFQRALTVPDLLMVLGPPGTGKTRTITEIARYCGSKHQRVLITSGTHKAVDNVLERMPPDLIIIRVGHESNVSEKMRLKMIDAQAQALQNVLLENTENHAHRLSRILSYKDEITTWERQLEQGLTNLFMNEHSLRTSDQQRTAEFQRVIAPFKRTFDEMSATLRLLETKIASLQKRILALQEKQSKAEKRSQFPLLGWLFKLLLHHSIARLAKDQQEWQQAQFQGYRLQQERSKVYQAGQQALQTDGVLQQHEHFMRALTVEREKLWQESVVLMKKLHATISDLAAVQPDFEPQDPKMLRDYYDWFRATRVKLERKAKLLGDWREELKKPTDQLYPELMRYADVVGATCIGTATAKGLEDLEFDLVIADEAGQISLPDLLVPLVRAKRAVLVGDHNQLPPFVDSEVQTWLKNLAAQPPEEGDADLDTAQIGDLLTKSAFEQLFMERQDPAHIVRFTRQGRMPRVIADFASRHYYGNRLGTFSEEKMQHTRDSDPLFRSPFAVVDVSDAPAYIKWEHEQRKLENLGEAGYSNDAEALLIASVAEIYQRAGKEWIVIVPYRAQARYIIRVLRKRIDAHNFLLEERVSTVDSFQGGERNNVIYGFTRSNKHGKIGFLKELRRLNVAMTRAKQQLVMVGNFSMLTQSENARFSSVMKDLLKYSADYGELLTYSSCNQRLQSVLDGKGHR